MAHISINIINNGEAIGSIGWLAKNAAAIRIGSTKESKQAAWLLDHDGKVITCLAIRDPYTYDSKIIERVSRSDHGTGIFAVSVSLTTAAWTALQQLIDCAVEHMDEANAPISFVCRAAPQHTTLRDKDHA